MFFEDLKTTLIECVDKLKGFTSSDYSPQQAIELCLEIETALFRARIKLERQLNLK